ncbi:MAG: hypothetical protein LBD77_10965 [Bifidobacteriaceae bacterium]|jgi:hypothetical protein|nr:hypothetical protein [Bifidobacteriaceae bacterium]
MGEPAFAVFLDANVLARPATRSLILFAGEASGYHATWSQRAEDEADSHLRPAMTRLAVVRGLAGQDLSATGVGAARFSATRDTDRQLLADAVAADARFLVTDNVDDFDDGDLLAVGVSAVNPDLFLSRRATFAGYQAALLMMANSMRHPARTPEELHQRLGRQHPLTVAAFATVYPGATPLPAAHNPPAVVFRGPRCLRCLRLQAHAAPLILGLCTDCVNGPEGTEAHSPCGNPTD